MLDNLVRYIGQGRHSKVVEEALAECEKKVVQLGADLEFLRKCHTRLFKAPPKEWIEERGSRIKEVAGLEKGAGTTGATGPPSTDAIIGSSSGSRWSRRLFSAS